MIASTKDITETHMFYYICSYNSKNIRKFELGLLLRPVHVKISLQGKAFPRLSRSSSLNTTLRLPAQRLRSTTHLSPSFRGDRALWPPVPQPRVPSPSATRARSKSLHHTIHTAQCTLVRAEANPAPLPDSVLISVSLSDL
jgi:hypothetical protein